MKEPLKIKYEDGIVTITIGRDTLVNSVDYDLSLSYGEDYTIPNKEVFVKSLVYCLHKELNESGETFVHRMFTQAAFNLVEQGEKGIEFKDD